MFLSPLKKDDVKELIAFVNKWSQIIEPTLAERPQVMVGKTLGDVPEPDTVTIRRASNSLDVDVIRAIMSAGYPTIVVAGASPNGLEWNPETLSKTYPCLSGTVEEFEIRSGTVTSQKEMTLSKFFELWPQAGHTEGTGFRLKVEQLDSKPHFYKLIF
jgi:hypothetical protein